MTRRIGGMAVGKYVPERVLRAHGLDTRTDVQTLVERAKKFDRTRPGYLSEAELSKAAEELQSELRDRPTTTSSDGVRYSRRALSDVKDAYLTGRPDRRFSDGEVLEAARRWDDGNKFLNKNELTAGALELQMSQDGTLSAGDVAAIRTWTGATRKKPT